MGCRLAARRYLPLRPVASSPAMLAARHSGTVDDEPCGLFDFFDGNSDSVALIRDSGRQENVACYLSRGG